MKRFLLAAALTGAALGAALMAPGAAAAKPAPAPTASPAPLPTATPEPPDIAIPRLLNALKANPNDTQAMVELAGEYLSINHPEAAVAITQRLLQMGTKTAQVYYLDGSSQQALGNTDAATSDLENASNLEPTNLAILGTLADLYVKQNRLADAERIANRAITFNKDDPKAYEALAGVYAAEQKWDDARAQLEKAYSLDPKDVTPLVQEAQTWVAQNTIPNALNVIDRAIAADPKNVQVLVVRAQLYQRANDTAKSAAAYDDAAAAATTDEERASIIVRKALMYSAQRQQALAQQTFDAAIKQYPAVTSLHTAYGEYWVSQRNFKRAQDELLTALRLNKSDVNALYDMAQISQSQGRVRDTINYLKQLSDVAPSAQTYAVLGQAYISVHDYKSAREACGRSFQMAQDPNTLGCVAGSDYNLKNYKEAASIFSFLDKQARAFMDHNPQLLYMAADTYAHTKQNAQAVDSYKRLLKIVKPGTKTYKDIKKQIAQLSAKHPAPAKKKHA